MNPALLVSTAQPPITQLGGFPMTRCPNVSLLALGLCTLATWLGGCASGTHVSAPSSRVSAQTLRSAELSAESYTKGSRVPRDARQAAALYEKACMAHDADAC